MFHRKILLSLGLLLKILILVACASPKPAAKKSGVEDTNPIETSTLENEPVHEEGSEEDHTVHWGYEGAGGPEHWADLNEAYTPCGNGVEQSPIDLTQATITNLENITFDYEETAVNILNNGHAIQVNYDKGSSITINGQSYNLLQFHFHAPSEHAVDGTLYPAEMHLVHADADGNLAVVGVFIAEGAENSAFTPVWDHLPREETDAIATGVRINARDLLPATQTIYRYNGSLTTPPCSEGVLWSMMADPVEMSAAQITAFTDIYNGTNRPLQPLNDRELQLGKTS